MNYADNRKLNITVNKYGILEDLDINIYNMTLIYDERGLQYRFLIKLLMDIYNSDNYLHNMEYFLANADTNNELRLKLNNNLYKFKRSNSSYLKRIESPKKVYKSPKIIYIRDDFYDAMNKLLVCSQYSITSVADKLKLKDDKLINILNYSMCRLFGIDINIFIENNKLFYIENDIVFSLENDFSGGYKHVFILLMNILVCFLDKNNYIFVIDNLEQSLHNLIIKGLVRYLGILSDNEHKFICNIFNDISIVALQLLCQEKHIHYNDCIIYNCLSQFDDGEQNISMIPVLINERGFLSEDIEVTHEHNKFMLKMLG